MIRASLIVFLAALSAATSLGATPTVVTVCAISRDAKVFGDGVGGARITIREAGTGKVLAWGTQTGGTGDTKRIMQEPRVRGAVVYASEGEVAYRATLELSGPTVVEIPAEGPLKYPQAMQRVSKTLLLLPGRHLEGEGVLLEIAGFIVDVPAMQEQANAPVPIRAKVTLTCPYAGQTSTNEGAVPALEAGPYQVEVLASDTRASNFGCTLAELVVRPAS